MLEDNAMEYINSNVLTFELWLRPLYFNCGM